MSSLCRTIGRTAARHGIETSKPDLFSIAWQAAKQEQREARKKKTFVVFGGGFLHHVYYLVDKMQGRIRAARRKKLLEDSKAIN